MLILLVLSVGCKPSQANPSDSAGSPTDPVFTGHWAGIKELATNTSAAGFMKIWRLPETEVLKSQTLDKLSAAPWRLASTNRPAITNWAGFKREYPLALMLRPLLDDLVEEEWFLEGRERTDHSPEAALAIRLEPGRSGIWETNLASVLEKATGAHRVPNQTGEGHAWRISGKSTAMPSLVRQVEFTRAGGWTVVAFGNQQNQSLSNFLRRIQIGQSPLKVATNTSWLETTFDLRRASRVLGLGLDLPADWPAISLTFNGDGPNVLTHGVFSFAKPLPFQVEPWIIPTDLVHEPIHSFTAVQGVQHWLSSWPWWEHADPASTPNQVFAWGQAGSPFLDYAAVPLADAHKAMAKVGPALIESFNPTLVSNRMGKWEKSANSDGVEWHAPVISPFVQSIAAKEGNFLLGGLSPFGLTNGAPPVGTFKELLGQANAVYYSREITGPRVEAWFYIGQIFRVILRRVQLPAEARSVAWLKAIAPQLGNSTTLVTKTGPNTLALSRESTLGLTGFEMRVLADWLESEEFPLRLHSVVAKLRPPPPVNSGARTRK